MNSQTLPFQLWMQQMRQAQKEQQHLQYHRNLIEQLVSNMRACAKKQGPLACLDGEETLDKKPHCSDKLPCQSSKDSAVCNDHKTKRGRKETVFFCKTCSNNPKLHPAECCVLTHAAQISMTDSGIKSKNKYPMRLPCTVFFFHSAQ